MSWYVKIVSTPVELQLFLRTQQTEDPNAALSPLDAANVVSIYFDAASGRHVIVYMK